jgi:RNase P/RNase MRP subunit p30
MTYWCFDLRLPESFEALDNFSTVFLSYLLELEYSFIVLGIKVKNARDLRTKILDQNFKNLLEALEDHGFKTYIMIIFESNKRYSFSEEKRLGIILGMEGGNKKKNLKIITKYWIDVLLNPSKDVKLKDYLHNVSSGIDDKLLNALKNKVLFFALPYSRIFDFSKYYQALLIRQLIQDLSLLKKRSVPAILSFSSSDPSKLRDPEDLLTLLEVFGRDRELSWDWLEQLLNEYPRQLLELKRHVLPGLQVVDLVEDDAEK